MEILQCVCTLLTDVVLSSQAATEGFHKSLSYIPGAKFLGLAASQLYDMNESRQTLDLFHNGSVRFGDAHPMGKHGGVAYQVPASWYHRKGTGLTDGDVYLYHQPDSYQSLLDDAIPLRSAQSGYFTEDGDLLQVRQGFSIKSAYNRAEYRAKDQQMYGYFALEKGSQWQFEVQVDHTRHIPLLVQALQGRKALGRSKTAQYGLVDIEITQRSNLGSYTSVAAGEAYLYAVSNLCFYDDRGQITLQPDPVKHLLLPVGSQIIWEKSQVRIRRYLTWNQHRSNRDADRLIIEKGSVLTLQLAEAMTSTQPFEKGIGAHRSEGFGQVLLNPAFLLTRPEKLMEGSLTESPTGYAPVEKGATDDLLLNYLQSKAEMTNIHLRIDRLVNRFMEENRENFKDVTASQWGQIRSHATSNATTVEALQKLLFDKEIGFCYFGRSESAWRKNGRREKLEKFLYENTELSPSNIFELTMKLASEMAKSAQN